MGEHINTSIRKMWYHLRRCKTAIVLYIFLAGFYSYCSESSKDLKLVKQNIIFVQNITKKYIQYLMLRQTNAPSLLSTAITSPTPSTSRAYLMDLNPDAAKA
jgi:hypothetical protein